MKICIDAGHNYQGYDTGAEGNGLNEQIITWQIAEKLKYLLSKLGHEVIMTRDYMTTCLGVDVDSSINERCKIANKNNVDYFISIHCNSGGGKGTETLIYQKGGKAEKLAEFVQFEVVKTVQTIDRGVKVQNVGVLRKTNMSAILVETGFIDSKTDSEFLKFRQLEFATAIANGFQKFIGGNMIMENNSKIKDLPNNHWANNTICELVEMGIINGDENGNVRPDAPTTRAEVMQMMRNTIRYITGK